jgi:integrase/recombinase XerD
MKLNSTDINFKGQLLYVRSGKGKKRRVVPLTEQVKTDLQNYYLYERSLYVKQITRDNQYAFVLNNWGDRMLGYAYWKRLKYLVQLAELPEQISLHHLRHSIATHLLESGLSIEQVRDFLGHRYLESTQIYTRISKQYLSTQL